MGFKALLMGRMKITTQLEMVPKGKQEVQKVVHIQLLFIMLFHK